MRLGCPVGNGLRAWYLLRLHFELDETGETSLLEISIETGRKHQIRRHLAGLGHPIIGDRLYGRPAGVPLQLLAFYLDFDCPLNKRKMTFELPAELSDLTLN